MMNSLFIRYLIFNFSLIQLVFQQKKRTINTNLHKTKRKDEIFITNRFQNFRPAFSSIIPTPLNLYTFSEPKLLGIGNDYRTRT